VIVRLAAAAALLVGLLGSLGYLHIMGRAPTASVASRHLRDMKDRDGAPATYAPITSAEMAALPRSRPLAEYSGLERRGVVYDGYVQRMARAMDGDIHLELVDRPMMPGDPEQPYFTAEIPPHWQRGSEAWSYDRILELFRPPYGGITAWEQGTRRVRIAGWLIYDFEYEGAVGPRPRLTHWEIHPVTRLERWDDSAGRFLEYPR
jgi:hypothetical protein